MKLNPHFLVIAAMVAGLHTATAADITGSITLNGKPPEAKEIPVTPECSKERSEPLKQKFYVVSSTGGLKDVVLSIKNISGKSTGASAKPLMVDQKGCEYIPSVCAVQTGQKIVVKNSDPFNHNIDVMPMQDGNKPSNKVQAAGAPDLTMSFPTQESFLRVKCDIHPWMFTYITVVDHPYFAVSDKDGKFKISDVPPGKYTLEAAHRKAGKATKEIEVKSDGTVVDFTLDVPK